MRVSGRVVMQLRLYSASPGWVVFPAPAGTEKSLLRRSPRDLATFHTDQPWTQGINALDCFGRGFRARPAAPAGYRHLVGLCESQIPGAGATAEGTDASHVL